MALLKILHPKEFDSELSRFRSSCFHNSSDGTGISLVDCDCIQQQPGRSGACSHIGHFYPHITGEPIAFWRIDPVKFPLGTDIKHTLSDTGDICHRELMGLSDNQSSKFFKRNCKPEDIYICENGQPRACTSDLLQTVFGTTEE